MASLTGPDRASAADVFRAQAPGRSLYEYARQGVEIERKPRQVVIHRLELLSFDGQDAVLDVQCSKGTYVRTLAADLGAKLGCGAHLAGLRRTRTAGFDIADAIALDTLVEMTPEARMAMLLPVDILVNHLPIHTLNDAETHKICRGQPVHVAEKDAIIQAAVYTILTTVCRNRSHAGRWPVVAGPIAGVLASSLSGQESLTKLSKAAWL